VDPPKDGSATVLKAEALRSQRSYYEDIILNNPLRTLCLCGEYSLTVNPENQKIKKGEVL
jgi:hypothetical protein